MPKGSRGGQGGDKHLGNSSSGGGYKGSVGNFPEKKNPFQTLINWQKLNARSFVLGLALSTTLNNLHSKAVSGLELLTAH